MATIPSFEHLLLHIHQSLGLPQPNSQVKTRFTGHDLSINGHVKKSNELLEVIFDTLELDAQARVHALGNIKEWGQFHSDLGLHTWTGNASAQQVVWHMLAYSYVPAFARRLAFWSLAGVAHGQPIDAGMPGGEFWFLPTLNRETDKFTLPVPQVLDWLLDLLEPPTLGHLSKGLGSKKLRQKDGNSTVVRTLQYWRAGTLPSLTKIDTIFPDDARLNFIGAFVLDTHLAPVEQLQKALAFVQHKGLNTATLHDQIPMTESRLEPVMNGAATDDETQEFVRLLAQRYAQPTMRTIRQRLRVARMTQDGYTRLLGFLCGDDVAPTCTDPQRNKLLQLLALFHTVYNLTIEAWRHSPANEVAQDAYFESKLAPWDKIDLLISIVPDENHATRLDECLSRRFMALKANSTLDDLVALGGTDASKAVILRRMHMVKDEIEEDLRTKKLIEQVQRSSPWRALQAENSYWVVSQAVQHDNLPEKTRAIALQRLRELASAPGQSVEAINIELTFLLNGDAKQRPKDIAQRVEKLLAKAKSSPGYDEWKAPLLRWQGKHNLLQDDFAAAITHHKAALAACAERGFGPLAGEIARDGWAIDIAENGLNTNNQEFWYRDMMRYGMFADGLASLEDTAVWCEEYFRSDLYLPYPGLERQQMQPTEDWRAVCEALIGFSAKADWDGLRAWLKRSAAKYQRVRFVDARRDTVLLRWIKFIHGLERKLPMAKTISPGWNTATALLIEAWPQQARIADFKGQTPLMLAADYGDVPLVKLLMSHLKVEDLDAQDFGGRTALHAAVASRSPECVAAVLERNPNVDRVSKGERNTVLHTAVRFGQPESVRLILDVYPGLAAQANAEGKTPFNIAAGISENWASWDQYMHRQNRQTGTIEDFADICQMLTVDKSAGR